MITKRALTLFILPVAASAITLGCSSSSSSSSSTASATTAEASGSKTAFCKDNADLNAAFMGASTPDAIVAAIKANMSKIDDFEANAPASEKANATTLAEAAKAAASTGKADALLTPAVQQAGKDVDSYCGLSTTTTGATKATA